MNEGQAKKDNLVETTDCLEAVGVLRGWKNFLFVIVVFSLILLQVSFWLVNSGYIKAGGKTEAAGMTSKPLRQPPVETPPPAVTPPPAKDLAVPLGQNQPKQPVEKSVAFGETAGEQPTVPNQPGETAAQERQPAGTLFGIKFEHLAWLIRFVNFVLILAAVLYCLTMLFILKVSLLGRLGGINHICRAFFLSLVMVVLLLPWQLLFGGVVAGAIYTPEGLINSCTAMTGGIFTTILFYLRFTGYWVLVMLLLIFSQIRSGRWTKATLRRLEVI